MSNNPEGQPGNCSAYRNVKKLIFMHHVFHIGKWGLLDSFNLSWLSRQQLQCMLLWMVVKYQYLEAVRNQNSTKSFKKRRIGFSVYSCSYVGSSWHRWPQSCTFHVGWVPAGAGWGHSAWGPGKSPYKPRHPGSPDRPAAQTTVIQYTGTITEPHTNDNTAFLYHRQCCTERECRRW